MKIFGNFQIEFFFEFATLQIFGIFKIEFFFNFLNYKFFEFYKLGISGIFQINNF